MKITILCSNPAHPVNAYLKRWISLNESNHDTVLARRKSELPGGHILFLISCSEIIYETDRTVYQTCLVLHASDVPRGRGWSPHIWEIINGAEAVTLSLLEVDDKVDSGKIWNKIIIPVPKHALWNEINSRLFKAEIEMIDFGVQHFQNMCAVDQALDIIPTYYRRRTTEDSRLDPDLSLAGQFDQIRVCDPQRFPAFFDLHGQRYKLILEKMDDQVDHN